MNLLKEANILNVVHMKLYLKIEKTKNILKVNSCFMLEDPTATLSGRQSNNMLALI